MKPLNNTSFVLSLKVRIKAHFGSVWLLAISHLKFINHYYLVKIHIFLGPINKLNSLRIEINNLDCLKLGNEIFHHFIASKMTKMRHWCRNKQYSKSVHIQNHVLFQWLLRSEGRRSCNAMPMSVVIKHFNQTLKKATRIMLRQTKQNG